ncbi:MAG TPA: hypothetical protein VMD05_09285 [Candidatus Nanoarchaeia archaeon]|nr:hypothetical protein [Candidatus Nanoarchaeia archaeon]
MKGFASKQKCELEKTVGSTQSELKMKCISVMVFEEAGKTILQPLGSSQETHSIDELFRNSTLEVWLPNGQSDQEQFDVAILKYKQQLQPTTMCNKTKNRECLKNHIETIVSCEQCPLSEEGATD